MNTSRTIPGLLFGAVLTLALAACGGSSDKVPDLEEDLAEAEAGRTEAEAEAARQAAAAEAARQAAAEAEAAKQAAEAAKQAAEAERERLANEALKAAARRALAGMNDALAGTGTGLLATTAVSIDPRYRATASVTEVPGVTFTTPQGSSSGKWYVTTLKNSDATSEDDMVVYTDLGPPVPTAIKEVYSAFDDPADDDDLYREITVSTVVAQVPSTTNHKAIIRSGRFPRRAEDGTIYIPLTDDDAITGNTNDPTVDDDRTSWFSGTFAGASGQFQCVGTAGSATACSVEYTGASTILGGGTWTFRTSKNTKVNVDDTSFMSFGWWRKRAFETFDTAVDRETFSYGHFGRASNSTITNYDALVGTASYEGPAIGQYAIYEPLGTQSNHGSFTATARLNANFDRNRLSGSVTGFDVPNDGWVVTLKETTMASPGTITAGTVSWTIGGDTQDGGAWGGVFHSEADPHQDTYPDGVAGTFTAGYQVGFDTDDAALAGRMVGAFGAHRQ